MCIWIQSVLDSDNSWTHIFHVNMNLKNQVIIKGKPKSKRVCELKQNIWWAASTGVVPRRKSIAGLVWKKTRGGQIVELAREEEKKKKRYLEVWWKRKGCGKWMSFSFSVSLTLCCSYTEKRWCQFVLSSEITWISGTGMDILYRTCEK